jgi:hypothetical protein
MIPDGPRLLTRQGAARYLGLGLRTFQRHVRPHVPAIRVGSRPMYQQEDLERWVDERKVKASSGRRDEPTSTSRSDAARDRIAIGTSDPQEAARRAARERPAVIAGRRRSVAEMSAALTPLLPKNRRDDEPNRKRRAVESVDHALAAR